MTDADSGSAGKDEDTKVARAVVAELDSAQREVLAEYMASLILLKQ